MSSIRFEQLLPIYRTARFEEDGHTATLTISSQEQLDAISHALIDENIDDSGIRMDRGAPADVQIGETVILMIDQPRGGVGLLAKDLGDLLGMQSACIKEPKRYFLIKEGFACGDEAVPANVTKYRKLLSFIALMKDCAAYQDDKKSELVFVQDGKFTIPVRFTSAQLQAVSEKPLDRLNSFFDEDMHREQKLSILSNTVLSILSIAVLNKRFPTLLTELEEVQLKFGDGYKLFVADFSYDKVRDEFETTKVEYAGKIHKVFTDIQNQLLSIPVATVIVATQMKPGAPGDPILWVSNTALLFGAWIFGILFCMLCANQYRTLKVLAAEIDRQEDVVLKKYSSVADMFTDVYTSLQDRIRAQRWFLGGVILILAVGLLGANVFYFRIQSTPATAQTKSATVLAQPASSAKSQEK